MAQQQLLMPKATAVWLVDNTALSFDQIAQFCKLHPLEIKAIADGEAAQGIKGLDPIATGQLSRDEIARAEADPMRKLKLADPKVRVPESKRKGPRLGGFQHRVNLDLHPFLPWQRNIFARLTPFRAI